VRTFYLRTHDGGLIRMAQQPFGAEVELEEMLADHPELITDHLGQAGRSPRWLLVCRQGAIPCEGWAHRWAVDIVFVDDEAVPVLVEVKRSTNTALRRGAVAQILDYAAHVVHHWSSDTLRGTFERTWRARQHDPGDVLAGFLGPDADPTTFWARAHANLEAGRLRLVFAADQIPPELQRVVEFLGRQMQAATVLAVEVQRFAHPVDGPDRPAG
jgi:hypothetical protein